jgi:hypothetical protein
MREKIQEHFQQRKMLFEFIYEKYLENFKFHSKWTFNYLARLMCSFLSPLAAIMEPKFSKDRFFIEKMIK